MVPKLKILAIEKMLKEILQKVANQIQHNRLSVFEEIVSLVDKKV